MSLEGLLGGDLSFRDGEKLSLCLSVQLPSRIRGTHQVDRLLVVFPRLGSVLLEDFTSLGPVSFLRVDIGLHHICLVEGALRHAQHGLNIVQGSGMSVERVVGRCTFVVERVVGRRDLDSLGEGLGGVVELTRGEEDVGTRDEWFEIWRVLSDGALAVDAANEHKRQDERVQLQSHR